MKQAESTVRVACLAAVLVTSLVAHMAAMPDDPQKCNRTTAPVNSGMMMPKPPPEFWGTHKDQEVVLDLIVKNDGTSTVREVVSSPGRNYTTAALEAVKEWTFEPGMCDGKPVEMPFTATVRFQHDREHM